MAEIMERGKIRNRNIASQIRDFTGLKFANVTPTDIDGFIEFNNCIYILIETKYQIDDIPEGQERALVNLIDTIFESSKKGLLIIAIHNNPSEEDILFHKCIVSRYRSRKNWYKPKKRQTVKDIINLYLKKNCIDCPSIKCSANIYVKSLKR